MSATSVCEARLDDGRIMKYDIYLYEGCDQDFSADYAYLGDGVIHTVNGTRQPGKTRLSFYRRKDNA